MPRGRPFVGGVSWDILDVLELDGGWLTPYGIELMIPHRTHKQITDSLHALKKRGEVESRVRWKEGRVAEAEYRITDAGIARMDAAAA